jgi:hypothetical protein
LVGGSASAVDGVLEINDTSVIAAGGYPFAIAAGGSYVLTGDLTPGPATGITVTAPNVRLDMNGFSIVGGGGPFGIDAGLATGFKVKNGSITGFALAGLLAGPESQVYKMRIAGNGAGITAGDCLVVENVITANGGVGLQANRCKVENNVISMNLDSGIVGAENVIVHNNIAGNGAGGAGGGVLSFAGSTIQENVIIANLGFGVSDTPGVPPGPIPAPPVVPFPILPPPGPPNNVMKNTISLTGVGPGFFSASKGLVTGNTINNNAADGVVCSIACQVSGNQVDSNNLAGIGNGGMTIGPGSTVNDNSISFNTGIGLVIDPTAGYMSNTLNANTVQDMSILVPAAPLAPHPTSGFMNLCTGLPGPAPGFCP